MPFFKFYLRGDLRGGYFQDGVSWNFFTCQRSRAEAIRRDTCSHDMRIILYSYYSAVARKHNCSVMGCYDHQLTGILSALYSGLHKFILQAVTAVLTRRQCLPNSKHHVGL